MKLTTVLLLAGLFPLFYATELRPVDTGSKITFVVKNFGININGELKGLTGKIKWDETNPAASVFNVSIDVKTINTGIEMRDSHLKEEEYFHVAKYPAINFTSTAVTSTDITGNLTIKGVTKQVNFPFIVSRTTTGTGFIFEGSFIINRKDFDVGSSSFSLGNEVTVNLKVIAVQ